MSAKTLWYDYLHITCRLAAVGLFRIRCHGRQHVPRSGGALVLSNHQSHLDPVLVGLAADRRLNFLARKTLFDITPLRLLIETLNGIPIDRDGLGLAGLKETLRRVRQNEAVLIFPEGTRSPDGEIAPFKPGFSALAKRVAVPLVPLGIDGAFQAWPRTSKVPRVGVIDIHFGPPVMPEETAALSDRELVSEVEKRIRACHAQARAARLRRITGASE